MSLFGIYNTFIFCFVFYAFWINTGVLMVFRYPKIVKNSGFKPVKIALLCSHET